MYVTKRVQVTWWWSGLLKWKPRWHDNGRKWAFNLGPLQISRRYN